MTDVTRMDIDGIRPTVPDLLRARASALGSACLLTCDDEVLTYEQAERESAELARGLLAIGVGKGTHVGLLYPNGRDFVVAAFAAARIGAVALPFSTMSTPHELQGMLRGADVKVLLSAESYRSRDFVDIVRTAVPELDYGAPPPVRSHTVPTLRRVFVATDRDDVAPAWRMRSLWEAARTVDEAALRAAEEVVRPADRLVIVHTSGSTSEPKAVIHQHGSLIRHMASFNAVRRYDSREILFSNSPFFWIGGYAANLIATLVAGAHLVCSNSRDAGQTLDLLERVRPTLVNGFAQSVAHLAAHPSFPSRDLSSIRRGNLYPIMPPDVRPADPQLRHNMLGMTEAGSVFLVDGDESDQPEHRRGSFGKPAPGFEVRVVDFETGRPCGVGELGELQLRGPFLMEGYYGRERHETFDPDGWFATGDMVYFDEDGFFYFKGRRNAMIKTSGANVSPLEVEEAIRALTGLTAHVVGVDDPERDQIVAAVVVAPEPAAVDVEELRRLLASRLSAYKVPRRIRVVTADQVPMMTSGKVDLRALKQLLS